MELKVRKITFILMLFAVIPFAHARMQNDIPCPSIAMVQQAAAKIDMTESYCAGFCYRVYTSVPAFYENNIAWRIYAITSSSSADNALIQGKEIVRNINALSYPQAMSYGCIYGPGDVLAIGADPRKYF